jgi:hypothetical protein
MSLGLGIDLAYCIEWNMYRTTVSSFKGTSGPGYA